MRADLRAPPTRRCAPCRSSRRRGARHAAARPRTHRRPGSAATAAAPTSVRTPTRRSRRTRRDASTVSSVQSLLQTSIASSTRRPRVWKSSSAATHSSSSQLAPIPNSKRPPHTMSSGLHGARRDERVAEPDVVDVGAEPDALGPAARYDRYANASKIGVSGGTGGCVSPGCGDRLIARVKTRCSGSHTDSNPSRSASSVRRRGTRGLSAPSATPNFTSTSLAGDPAAVRGAAPPAGGEVAAVDVHRRAGHEARRVATRGRARRPRRRRRRPRPGAASSPAIVAADARRRDDVGRDAVDADQPVARARAPASW